MSRIIFVNVRNDHQELYHSYVDFHTLIALSNFPTCEINEIDYGSDNVYIFSPYNGYVKEVIEKPRSCKFIVWELERPQNNAKLIQQANAMWVSDKWFWKLVNSPKCKMIPIGGHKNLGSMSANKLYDFIHVSYLIGERKNIIDRLKQQYSIAPNGWGAKRNLALSQSKIGLCLHQTPEPIIEPLRYTLFSCWKLPIIAEYSRDFYPYKVYKLKDIDNLINKWQTLDWQTNFQKLTEELTFKKCVEAML